MKLRVVDNSGTLYLTFFNQSYLKNSFQPGEEYVFYGGDPGAGLPPLYGQSGL